MKHLLGSMACAMLLASTSAHAASYVYVGSWNLGDGPYWGTNPQVYSGQEAAAFLFGGQASDYAISTVSSDVADINFSTWLDGWGDGFTYADSGTPASQSYSLDTGGGGYNSNPGSYSAYSAYIGDHFGPGSGYTNYAFRVVGGAVPESATWAMLMIGFGGVAAAMRKRRAPLKATRITYSVTAI